MEVIESAKEIIKKEKPDLIVMSLETGQYALAIILAAREKNIPTVGVQHGMIYPKNPAYIHKNVARSLNSLEFPIPDKTAA